MAKYLHNGKILEVLTGLGADCWIVGVLHKNGTGRHRFVTKACPVRTTRDECQADLDEYARKHKLLKVEETV